MVCPGCRQDVVPTPVRFTWWGGVLGPRLLSHVQCPGCTTRFNGKSGALNTTAIAIYMVLVGVITFGLLFAVFTQMSCGPTAPAYPAAGQCFALADQPADWCDGEVTTVGAVLVEPSTHGFESVHFQDLENVDPNRSPYVYRTMCHLCLVVEGQAYRARLTKEGRLYSILVDGREIIAGTPFSESEPSMGGLGFYDAAGRSSVINAETCGKPDAHWERQPLPSSEFWSLCVDGKDTRPWPLAGPTEQAALPACNEHGPYANRTFQVVITVTPGGGMSWTFDEAAAEVAHHLLYDLNQNGSGLQFVEASGVASEIDIAVTLTQIIDGTERDTAEATVTGLGEGYLFSMTSGDAPFTSWREAIGALARNLLGYFVDGWHNKRPCVKRDRSILR